MTVFLRNMKYWEVVLQEVFLLPLPLLRQGGKDLPANLEELATLSGLKRDEIVRILAKVDALQEVPVEISAGEIPSGATMVDVRHPEERALAPVPGAVCLQEVDLSVYLPVWRQSTLVVMGRDAGQAWSAAMYLREHGCARAFSLLAPVQG